MALDNGQRISQLFPSEEYVYKGSVTSRDSAFERQSFESSKMRTASTVGLRFQGQHEAELYLSRCHGHKLFFDTSRSSSQLEFDNCGLRNFSDLEKLKSIFSFTIYPMYSPESSSFSPRDYSGSFNWSNRTRKLWSGTTQRKPSFAPLKCPIPWQKRKINVLDIWEQT